MSMNTKQSSKYISELISNYDVEEVDSGIIRFECGQDRDQIHSDLLINGIEATKEGKKKVRIDLSEIYCHIYLNEESFIAQSNFFVNKELNFIDKSIFLLTTEYSGFVYLENKRVFNNEDNEIEYSIFENLNAVNNIFSLISNSDSKLISYHDTLKNHFVVSTPEQSIFKIGYTAPVESLIKKHNFLKTLQKLKTILKRDDYIPHFKKALIEKLLHTNSENRFYQLLVNINEIESKADYYYELYLNQFSFQKLKSELRKEKEKYFTEIRDVINKLLNKVVTIPISVSATVFALFRLSENTLYSLFVVLSFIIYSLFTYYLLDLIKNENDQLFSQLDSDVKIIREESGLKNAEINPFHNAVLERIVALRNSIKILKITLVGISCVLLYLFLESKTTYNEIIIVILIILFSSNLIKVLVEVEE